MSPQSKSARGELMDLKSDELVAEVSVDVSLLPPPYSVEHPKFQATLTLNGYRPELSDKAYTLRLNKKITGRVFLSESVVDLDTEQTHFNLVFQDPAWRGEKWFKSM